MNKVATAVLCAVGFVAGDPLSGLAQDVLSMHRLSAGLLFFVRNPELENTFGGKADITI